MAERTFQIIEWIRWIWSEASPLDTQESAVLTLLARRADKDGACYPGLGTICAETKVSRRKVISAIHALESHGLLRKAKQRRGNGFDRNHYSLKLTPPGSASGALPMDESGALEAPPQRGTSAPEAPRVVHEVHLGSAHGTLEVTHEVTHGSNPGGRASKIKNPRRRWIRVPNGWEPSDAHRTLGAKLGIDFDHELAQFRDNDFKSPKVDPDACFRTWLRNAKKYQRTGFPARPSQHAPQRGLAEHVRMGSIDDLV